MKGKVIFFDHAPILSGGERSLLDILRAFPWEDFEPILVCPSQGPLTAEASRLGVRVETLPVSRVILDRRRDEIGFLSISYDLPKVLSSALRLRRLLHRERTSLLVTNSQKAHLIGTLGSFLTSTPLFWYFRDILPVDLRMLCLPLGLLPKRIIAISEAVGDQFSTGGRRWNKVVVIPNAIDPEAVRKRATATGREHILGEFGFPQTARLVGAVGQIAPWKGQRYFIQAAREVARRFSDVYFLVVGDVLFGETDYKRELVRLVRELGLADRLVLTGYREDPYPLMNAVDILVHSPIKPEPFGRVLVEAMALGKPIVASDAGAAPEILCDGETGVLVPPGDSEALARELERLLLRPAVARKMGSKGAERVRRFFTLERLVKDLGAVLESVPRRG